MLGSFARCVLSISRRNCSSSSVTTRRARFGAVGILLGEGLTKIVHELLDWSDDLRLILHRLSGIERAIAGCTSLKLAAFLAR